MLSVKELQISIGQPENVLLTGFNHGFKPNTITALVAPSGTGKTTMLRSFCGLHHLYEGEIRYRGKPYASMNMSDFRSLRQSKICYLPQIPYFPKFLTVDELLNYYCIDTLSKERVTNILDALGLGNLQNRYYNELSYGQVHRVRLALSVINQPDILCLDEPLGHLDLETSRLVTKYLRQFASDGGAVILSSHREKNEWCDEIVDLREYLPHKQII